MQLPPKPHPYKISQLVIFTANRWNFYDLSLLEFKDGRSAKYARPDFQFGTVKNNESNPSKVCQTGIAGDYLFQDSAGNLTIIPRDQSKFYV